MQAVRAVLMCSSFADAASGVADRRNCSRLLFTHSQFGQCPGLAGPVAIGRRCLHCMWVHGAANALHVCAVLKSAAALPASAARVLTLAGSIEDQLHSRIESGLRKDLCKCLAAALDIAL